MSFISDTKAKWTVSTKLRRHQVAAAGPAGTAGGRHDFSLRDGADRRGVVRSLATAATAAFIGYASTSAWAVSAPANADPTVFDPAVFDLTYYRARYRDLAALPDATLKWHWQFHGVREGRQGSALFHSKEYLENYPDLRNGYGATNYGGVINHFAGYGRKELRDGMNSAGNGSWIDLLKSNRQSPAIYERGNSDSAYTFPGYDGKLVSAVVKRPRPTLGGDATMPAVVPGSDATAIFNSAVARAVANKASRLIIPRGTYHFMSMQGSGAHFNIRGAQDLTIEGQGATLIFHNNAPGIRILASTRLHLSNLTIDFADSLRTHSLGRIEKRGDRTVLAIDSAYQVTTPLPVRAVTAFDPVANRWRPMGAELFFFGNEVPRYEGNQIYSSPSFANVPLGTYLVRHEVYGGMAIEVGVHYPMGTADVQSLANEDVTLTGINIIGGPGMGVLVRNLKRGFRMADSVIAKSPAPGRLISLTADGLHVLDAGGDLIIEGNDFSMQGDDAINLSGRIQRVDTVDAASSRFTVYPSFSTPYFAGQQLAFFNRGMGYLGSRTIKSVVPGVDGKAPTTVVLNGSMPANVRVGGLIRNVSMSGSRYVIKNNKFHDNRARGILAQMPNGLIDGNQIYGTSMNAMVLLTNSAYWNEGIGAVNVRVSNNTISNVGAWSYKGAITVVSEIQLNDAAPIKTGGASLAVNADLVIEDNTITSVPGNCLYLGSLKNASVMRNRCQNTNMKAAGNAEGSASIAIVQSKDIRLDDNNRSGTSGPVYLDSLTVNPAFISLQKLY